MRENILSEFCNTPVAIRESALTALLAKAETAEPQAASRLEELGQRKPFKKMGSVAVIPVTGPLAASADWFDRMFFGLTSYADIQANISEAESDNGISSVVFDITSPGGSTNLMLETASAIAEMKKPTAAWVTTQANSAAFCLAAATGSIGTSISASLGSVGVFAVLRDVSAMYAAAGIATRVFRSGPQKGAGVAGTSLSDEQAQHVQSTVDELGNLFTSFVKSKRPGIAAQYLDGRDFIGQSAVARGFADRIFSGFPSFLQSLTGSSMANNKNTDWKSQGFGTLESFEAFQRGAAVSRVRITEHRAIVGIKPAAGSSAAAPAGSDLKTEWAALTDDERAEFAYSFETFIAFEKAQGRGAARIVKRATEQ